MTGAKLGETMMILARVVCSSAATSVILARVVRSPPVAILVPRVSSVRIRGRQGNPAFEVRARNPNKTSDPPEKLGYHNPHHNPELSNVNHYCNFSVVGGDRA
jgi:hypothetical protein